MSEPLLELGIVVTAIVAAASLIDRPLLLRRPALRAAVWSGALVAVALSPALVAAGRVLPWRVGLLAGPTPVAGVAPSEPVPFAPVAAPTLPPVEFVALPIPTTPARAVDVAPAPAVAAPPTPVDLAPLIRPTLFAVWLIGASALLARLAVGAARVRRLRRGCVPLTGPAWDAEVAAVARALGATLPHPWASPDAPGPLVAGLISPRVILPLDWHLPGGDLRAVLLHEYAHVVRRDPRWRLLQRLAGACLWFHPGVHLLNRRLDAAREDVCDNHALLAADPVDYAEALLTAARFRRPGRTLSGSLTMISRRNDLERRVRDLLDARRDPRVRLPLRQRLAVLGALIAALIALPSVGLRQVAARPDEKPAPVAEAKEKPAAVGVISGRAVDAAGKPVGGATIYRLGYGNKLNPYRPVTSDQTGAFALPPQTPGSYVIWAVLGDTTSRSPRWTAVEVPNGGAAKPVTLTLKPAATLRARVLTEDGKPVPGARLLVAYDPTPRPERSDANGVLELRALPVEKLEVTALAPGFARVKRVIQAKPDMAPVDFRLPPGGTVIGRVTDGDNKPLAGAKISVQERTGNVNEQIAYLTADADGRFRVEGVSRRNTELHVEAPDYSQAIMPIKIGPSGEANVIVSVQRRPYGGAIRGVVTDANGKPIAGAVVTNTTSSSARFRRTTTDAAGAYAIDDVYNRNVERETGRIARYELIVKGKGFAPKRLDFKPGTAAKPADVPVALDPGHTIKARVVGPDGKPVADAFVHFPIDWMVETAPSTHTDAEGRFSYDSLPAGARFNIDAKGYSSVTHRELPLDGNDEIVVILTPVGVIPGRVTDAATGQPVKQFTVRLDFAPDSRPDDPYSGLHGNLITPGTTFAPPDGRFAIPDLVAGQALQVIVEAEGYRRLTLRRVVAQPAPSAKPQDYKLTPEDPAKSLTIRGKLLDSKGNPIRGAELRLIASDPNRAKDDRATDWGWIERGHTETQATTRQVQKGATAADGSFTFQGVPADAEIQLAYWGGGIPRGRVEHLDKLPAAERAALTVNVPAPASLTVAIDQAAIPGVNSIGLSGFENTDKFKPVGPASYRAGDLPAGKYTVTAYATPQPIEGSSGWTVRPLATTTVTLKVGEQAKVEMGAAEREPER